MSTALRRLAEERALFVRRAALEAPAPPPFSAVLARAREGAISRRPRRVRLWSALAAAAALVLVVEVAGRHPAEPRQDEAAAIVAEPVPSGESCQDPSVIAAGATAREEHAYGACLTGTPNCAAPPSDVDEGQQADDETCVTCEACGPHPGEDLETRPRGEDAP